MKAAAGFLLVFFSALAIGWFARGYIDEPISIVMPPDTVLVERTNTVVLSDTVYVERIAWRNREIVKIDTFYVNQPVSIDTGAILAATVYNYFSVPFWDIGDYHYLEMTAHGLTPTDSISLYREINYEKWYIENMKPQIDLGLGENRRNRWKSLFYGAIFGALAWEIAR